MWQRDSSYAGGSASSLNMHKIIIGGHPSQDSFQPRVLDYAFRWDLVFKACPQITDRKTKLKAKGADLSKFQKKEHKKQRQTSQRKMPAAANHSLSCGLLARSLACRSPSFSSLARLRRKHAVSERPCKLPSRISNSNPLQNQRSLSCLTCATPWTRRMANVLHVTPSTLTAH